MSMLARSSPAAIATLLVDTADLILLLNADDVIADVSGRLCVSDETGPSAWRGLRLAEVLTVESQQVAERLLRDLRDGQAGSRVELRHVADDQAGLLVQYSAVATGDRRQVVLAGRDLRPIDDMRLALEASRGQSEENRRSRMRSDSQYRALFEIGGDAVIVIDAASGLIREANRHAGTLLRTDAQLIAGRPFAALLDPHSQTQARARLRGVQASRRPDQFGATDAGGARLSLSVHPFSPDEPELLLIRLSAAEGAERMPADAEINLGDLIRGAPEPVLLTDLAGHVLWANEAFLSAAQIPLAAHVLGRRLEDFLEPPGMEIAALLSRLERQGRMRLRDAVLRGDAGAEFRVELSAVSMPDASPPGHGFVMRADETEERGHAAREMPAGMEGLMDLIGRVPMKDLVRDTTDLIERMCIESALDLTANNRAAAARVLGMSRQALYLKLERFGIADK